jgi:hypothetical protein
MDPRVVRLAEVFDPFAKTFFSWSGLALPTNPASQIFCLNVRFGQTLVRQLDWTVLRRVFVHNDHIQWGSIYGSFLPKGFPTLLPRFSSIIDFHLSLISPSPSHDCCIYLRERYTRSRSTSSPIKSLSLWGESTGSRSWRNLEFSFFILHLSFPQ